MHVTAFKLGSSTASSELKDSSFDSHDLFVDLHFPHTSKKHRWIADPTLPLGVIECVCVWMCVCMRAWYGLASHSGRTPILHPGIYPNPDQDEVVTDDEWLAWFSQEKGDIIDLGFQ